MCAGLIQWFGCGKWWLSWLILLELLYNGIGFVLDALESTFCFGLDGFHCTGRSGLKLFQDVVFLVLKVLTCAIRFCCDFP